MKEKPQELVSVSEEEITLTDNPEAMEGSLRLALINHRDELYQAILHEFGEDGWEETTESLIGKWKEIVSMLVRLDLHTYRVYDSLTENLMRTEIRKELVRNINMLLDSIRVAYPDHTIEALGRWKEFVLRGLRRSTNGGPIFTGAPAWVALTPLEVIPVMGENGKHVCSM